MAAGHLSHRTPSTMRRDIQYAGAQGEVQVQMGGSGLRAGLDETRAGTLEVPGVLGSQG